MVPRALPEVNPGMSQNKREKERGEEKKRREEKKKEKVDPISVSKDF